MSGRARSSAGVERPPRAHAAQTVGTGAAQQREQYRFALILGVMRRRDDAAVAPARSVDQRRVARRAQALLVARRRRSSATTSSGSSSAPRLASATHSSCQADARTP